MSGEGPVDKPPPPPPPDPPRKQYEAAAVTDEGGPKSADNVERHLDQQATVGSTDGTNSQSESMAAAGAAPDANDVSLTPKQELERWKQADAKMYSDRLERATPEQLGEMREAEYREFNHTNDQMQATALKNDPESNEAYREAYNRNQIAQQRLGMIGGMDSDGRQPPDGGSPNGGTEQPHQSELGDPKKSYVERLPVKPDPNFGPSIDKSQPPGISGTAAEVVGGNLEKSQTIHDQATVGDRTATTSVDRSTVDPDVQIDDVNAMKERVRLPDGRIDLKNLPNCTACAKAVDARLAGDSTAQAGFVDYRALDKRSSDLPGARPARGAVSGELLQSEWEGHPVDRHQSWAGVEQKLIDGGPGTRGVLLVDGHVANVLNNDGKIQILDGQIGKRYDSWADYEKVTSFKPGDVRGWIKTSPEGPGTESTSPTRADSPAGPARSDSRMSGAEDRAAESRQAQVGAEQSAARAVETARVDARAEVIQAERDVGAADKEIRNIEDKAPPVDSADSRKLDDLKNTRTEASDRLDENLTAESNPESAVKGGEIREAELARSEAEQAERAAEDARRRQQP